MKHDFSMTAQETREMALATARHARRIADLLTFDCPGDAPLDADDAQLLDKTYWLCKDAYGACARISDNFADDLQLDIVAMDIIDAADCLVDIADQHNHVIAR